ncbi:28S ribosomal protein S11, mitochondrial [Colletes gigas]|uniref:28S ribosomal protein S11, mitochondrial n=1 Tax=Colletes gigas TaxID=935657 RepID=UPI001C9AC94C|nr:28S ribosomal protein S11, mitochondrial [Colletes gigas]
MIGQTLRLVTCSPTKVRFMEHFLRLSCPNSKNVRSIHITSPILREFRSENKKVRASNEKSRNLSVEGEDTIEINYASSPQKLYPDALTPFMIFDGVPYKDLHILNIKATRNNTIMSVTDSKGLGMFLHTCGMEGFKNAKKGTNIAAQQAAITLGTRILDKGIKTIRVRVQGIGPGRLAAIKGLHLTGLSIVSITDDTRVSWNPLRARKPRRI